jgi:hypothetical protein
MARHSSRLHPEVVGSAKRATHHRAALGFRSVSLPSVTSGSADIAGGGDDTEAEFVMSDFFRIEASTLTTV